MKYIFRIISFLFSFIVPIMLIYTAWTEKDYLKLAIWLVAFISNIFVFKEIFNLLSKDDNEDPIEYMKKKL